MIYLLLKYQYWFLQMSHLPNISRISIKQLFLFQLIVSATDPRGRSANASVIIRVNHTNVVDNDPYFDPPSYRTDLPLNAAENYVVISVTAQDPDLPLNSVS